MSFLGKYKLLLVFVIILSLGANVLTLSLPLITSNSLDKLQNMTYDKNSYLRLYGGVSTLVFICGILLAFFSNFTAEKIAKELRRQVVEKLSRQSFNYINEVTSAKLLTNLTVDTDSVKNFVSQGLVISFTSLVQLIGSAILLLTINWKLALPVLLTVPILLVAFAIIFKSIDKYFNLAKEAVDLLNRVINETIVGSALVRVLNSQSYEITKFSESNQNAKQIGIKIVNGFASLVPIIVMVLNLGLLVVLGYGGVQVIDGGLSNGDFAAFFSYVFTFITPIIMLGFLGSTIGLAFAAYERIMSVVNSTEPVQTGKIDTPIQGNISLKNITLDINNKKILNNISLDIKAGSKVAIIGPTASGKTQIFYLITGLIRPNSGSISIDGNKLDEYEINNLYKQLGMVFQDSIIFNTTIRENIAFRTDISDESVTKAIESAELRDFLNSLPDGLDTVISERGSSLSGGQKQRLTLARALTLNPKILLLDDFTARVDINTENKILKNIEKNYPETTLISITQKIDPVKDFDQIILLMEGEIIGSGKHEELLRDSFEYQQIYNSQKQIK